MLRCAIFFLFLSCWISPLSAQYDICKIAEAERDLYKEKKKAQNHGLHDNYNVRYHRISWEIDPSVRFISGKVLTVFESGNTPLNRIYFDLSSQLIVDSVVMKGGNISYFHQLSDLLKIGFADDIPAHSLDSVTVFYHGVPPESGFGSFAKAEHEGCR